MDAYAFHPYGIDKPEGGMGTMEVYTGARTSAKAASRPAGTAWKTSSPACRSRLPSMAHPNIPVWLNEWGMNVSGLDYNYKPNVGEYTYAKYITRFYIYSGWLGHPGRALGAVTPENLPGLEHDRPEDLRSSAAFLRHAECLLGRQRRPAAARAGLPFRRRGAGPEGHRLPARPQQ